MMSMNARSTTVGAGLLRTTLLNLPLFLPLTLHFFDEEIPALVTHLTLIRYRDLFSARLFTLPLIVRSVDNETG